MPTTEDLLKFLDELGSRLGPYAEQGWNLLVTQKRVEGIIYSILLLLFTVLVITSSVIFYRKLIAPMYKNYKAEKNAAQGYYNSADPFPVYMLTALAIGMPWVLWFCLVPWQIVGYIMQSIIPEYYVLMDLMNTVK